ncbi:acyl-CoA dehydrogenase family protein [Chloroflexota bacterium]
MDFTLPEEISQLRLLARRFIRQELLPLEKQVEETGEFPKELRGKLKQKAVELGLWNYSAPVEYGGGGMGILAVAVVHAELGWVSQSLGLVGDVIGVGSEYYLSRVTEEQKKKYLLPLVGGEKEFFAAMTEPNAGSDVSNMETRADKRGDSYILNGTKIFITNADRADFGLVWVVADWQKRAKGSITCFIVDRDTPGMTARHITMLGRHGASTCEVNFVDCVVPEKNILGELGGGLSMIRQGLVLTRIAAAAYCIGAAERVFQISREYAKQRVTFGKTLAERQLVQSMLVDTAMDIYASRMMLYNVAWEADQGIDVQQTATMLKIFATEMACRAADRGIQIHGGYGYNKELPLELIYRDVRLMRIGDGATEVLKSWLGTRLLEIPFT